MRDLNDATAVMSSNGYDSDDTNSLKIGSEKIDIVTSTGAFLAQGKMIYSNSNLSTLKEYHYLHLLSRLTIN